MVQYAAMDTSAEEKEGRWRKVCRFLSHDSGAFAQFVKYGVIGVMATCVQTVIFYVMASTCLKCLTADDLAVKFLGLPSVAFTGNEAWYASRGMIAAAAYMDGDHDFAAQWLPTLEKWVRYLIEYGEDPGEQLCTDDFAGHLARNVNLSAKAVVGVACYARILKGAGRAEEAVQYEEKAKAMAQSWLERATTADGHTALTFDGIGWSMKYNLVWDKVLGLGLLPEEFYEKETDGYLARMNQYGLPLDSRKSYTKSDWLLWVASMAKQETFQKFIAPVVKYLRESQSRVAFSDWYDTETGLYEAFIGRSVQGGLFMPLLLK